jgi:hypothetical protein
MIWRILIWIIVATNWLQIDGLKIETHFKPCQAHERKLLGNSDGVANIGQKHHQELKSFAREESLQALL